MSLLLKVVRERFVDEGEDDASNSEDSGSMSLVARRILASSRIISKEI